ncbi:uncharacterized protein Z518_01918 [Rhinocladiella mackenziei CBS 650.93]|uniref:Dioxygenase n=1 Tax=Rhinocladiella mackenziei CBS 650.93 TaxID=1442369 RepID=A0A0D2JDK3_9EURO|nr:uncharacterized protein Z518_01918 [Rhinocladiella mackenziei CBS 650.93]KIX07265.1 hypothetical protein Z518_01918 [Rhinocladiella mackenziei CBS 650.93]
MGATTTVKPTPPSHYKDWPNTWGFDTHYEERTPVELRIEGTIPAYAAGTLFRTGLGPRTFSTSKDNEFCVNHWFDNFSQVHRFQIHAPQSGSPVRVTYNSRLTSDGLIEKIKKTGKLDGFTFAAKYDPCKSFFQKIQSVFQPAPRPAPNEVNVGVTMSVNFPGLSSTGEKLGNHDQGMTLCTKTDANVFQMLDPETLEPVGVASQSTLHPDLKGAGSGAHAKSDPMTGDVFNYNLDFGRAGTYRVFRASASTGKTSILAKFHHSAAYLHSLFLTENYVVLCVWNSFYKAGGASILWNRNLLDAMMWDDKQPTTWFVVDKRPAEEGGRGLIAKYTSDAFYSFHTINAYEEPSSTNEGSVDIVADLAAYENMDVLDHFYLDNLISNLPKAHAYAEALTPSARPDYRRYRLPCIPSIAKSDAFKAVLEHTSSKADAFELPIINPKVVTKKHRYMYGISDTGKSSFVDGLVKYDAETHSTLRWSQHGQTAGEPIFVADPQSDDEDGGVLLSVVLDGPGGKSFLLILDAKTMEEVGRAHVDGVIGFGFHGLHVKSQEPVGRLNGLHL